MSPTYGSGAVRVQRLSLLFVMFFVFISTAFSAPTAFEPSPLAITRTSGGFSLSVEALTPQWEKVSDEERLVLQGAGLDAIAGGPEIPVFSQLIAIPAGMDLQVETVNVSWMALGKHILSHDIGADEAFPVARNSALYEKATYTDAAVVEVVSCGRWRDVRVALIVARPVRLTGWNQVEMASELSAQLQLVPSAEPDGYDPPGVSEAMLPLYKAFIPNVLDEINEEDAERGSIMFIVPEHLQSLLQPLVDWRRKCGYHVVVKTTSEVGSTSDTGYRNYIHLVYSTIDPPLEYVVFVGDSDGSSTGSTYIPTYHHNGGDGRVGTDHKFTYPANGGTTLESTLPLFHIGRISVDDQNDLSTIVAKILKYEKTPETGNQQRWRDAVLIANAQTAHSCGITQEWVRGKLEQHDFQNVHMMVNEDFPFPSPYQLNSIIDNQGVSWIGYRGRGGYYYWTGFSPEYYRENVYDLDNGDNLPVVTSFVCGGGEYDYAEGDCLGEVWLRAGTEASPKGAVAFIGPTELHTHTRWNNVLISGWYINLLDYNVRTMSQCMLGCKMMLEHCYPLNWNAGGGNTNSVWFYFHTYNVLGDPALQLRAETPRHFQVVHHANVCANDNHFIVNVEDQEHYPVAFASVVLTDTDGEIVSKAFSDANGCAILEFAEAPTTAFSLTVTRPEFLPYEASIPLVNSFGLEVTDEAILEASGDPNTNQDGSINPGELVRTDVTLRAFPGTTMSNVIVEVGMLDPDQGTIVVAEQQFGTVTGNEEIELDACTCRLAQELTDGAALKFLLRVYDQTGLRQTICVSLAEIVAPVLSIDDYLFSEDLLPGATTELLVTLSNNHETLDLGQVTGEFLTEDPTISATGVHPEWSQMTIGASHESNVPFQIVISEDAMPGQVVNCRIRLITEADYERTIPFIVTIDGASANTPTGPAGPGYYIYEENDSGFDHTPSFSCESIASNVNAVVHQDLMDRGDNNDKVKQIDLPFEFPFWNSVYNEISVCSNGWISFERCEQPFFRNRPLPGPLTPNGGVFAFWDDMYSPFGQGDGGVYTLSDEAEGIFVIEWSNMEFYTTQHDVTFRLVLFDPETHGTSCGMGKIGFVYDEVSDDDVTDNYGTIGVTSPDGLEAIQYTFAHNLAPTAAGISNGSTLLLAAKVIEGTDPPELVVEEPFLQANSVGSDQIETALHIRNTGGQTLHYQILSEDFGIEDELATDGLDAVGALDGENYFWIDSREAVGPDYEWIDIESSGNQIRFHGGTQQGFASVSDACSLPFIFPFYDHRYSSFFISESGYITFLHPGSVGNFMNTSELPSANAPRAAILPFWDNIGVDDGGHVYVDVTGERAVITWKDVRHLEYEEDGKFTFQLIIKSTGEFIYQYKEMTGTLTSATLGTNAADGLVGSLVCANDQTTELLANQYAIRFSKAASWMTFSPASASVAPGAARRVNVTLTPGGERTGYLSGNIIVYAPIAGQYQVIPVKFYVAEESVGAAPRVDPLPAQSFYGDHPFVPFDLDVYVDDWDNSADELQWRVMSQPEGLRVFIDEEHRVTIEPSGDWDGSSIVSFHVNDPSLNQDVVSVVFNRHGQDDAPILTSAVPASVGEIAPGTIIEFQADGVDPEGQNVSCTWLLRDEEVASCSNWSHRFNTLGDHTVQAVLRDPFGHSTIRTWRLRVTETAVDGEANDLPKTFALENVYPNPFNARMTVCYALPESADVEIGIYNLLGQRVATKKMPGMAAGFHTVSFDAQRWSSGIYFVQWNAGATVQTRKAVLVK